jgi:hypothetical protein
MTFQNFDPFDQFSTHFHDFQAWISQLESLDCTKQGWGGTMLSQSKLGTILGIFDGIRQGGMRLGSQGKCGTVQWGTLIVLGRVRWDFAPKANLSQYN